MTTPRIRCKVVQVGDEKTPSDRLARLLETVMQDNANKGWTLRAAMSRGGDARHTNYLFFAKKQKAAD